MNLRWRCAAWTLVLAVGAVLSGCALRGGTDASVFATGCSKAVAGYYCVQPGDTLESVAFGFGRKPEDLARWNGFAPNTTLLIAQMLRVAPPDWTRAPIESMPAPGAAATAATAATAASGAGSLATADRFVWPVSGMIVQEFGTDGSRGIEIAGRAGAPIKAAAAGRVVYAGGGIKSYGLMIIVKHDDGYVTAYGNNRKLLVREGETVQQGMTIAEMGARSGRQPLLQFEMREGSHAVDPLAHLPAGSGPVSE